MTAATATIRTYRATQTVLSRFTFRRMLRGALIFGIFAGIENIIQGFAIVAAYPDVVERTKVVGALSSNPAFGMLYGDPHAHIETPAGYMVYRTIVFLALVAAIWGMLFVTKMLRGQEEDGRWELLISGPTTARRATLQTLLGAAGGLLLAYVLIVTIIAVAGTSDKLHISLQSALFYGLALTGGGAVFMSIAALASQLAPTRRRAILYGTVTLLIFFAVRGIGNVAGSLAWLKNLSPFGWIDKTHPFINPQPIWLLPLGILAAICVAITLYLAGKRDLDDSIIADNDTAKPRFRLLNSQLGFNFRMNRTVLFGWLIGCVTLSGLMAGVAKTAANSLEDSRGFSKAVANLTGGSTNAIASLFLGIASYFVALILMFMVINGLSAIRDEEGRGRLDNFMAGPIARSQWLIGRLATLAVGSVLICLVSSLTVWAIAAQQGINVDAPKLIFGGLNILAPVFLLLGAGVFFYGLRPRLALATMYVWVAWSFTIDIIVSIVHWNKLILDTSLLRHISLVPATDPKWGTFVILTGLGATLATLGTFLFRERDLTAE